MPLITEPPSIPAERLMFVGVPCFIAAVALSGLSHIAVHETIGSIACGNKPAAASTVMFMTELRQPHADCGWSAFAAVGWTVGLAIAAFFVLLRAPGNLFVASMAFVNASARLPETITVFVQYMIHGRPLRRVDEALTLGLLGPVDATIPTLISCFYTIVSISFAVIVVHDIRGVKRKWLIVAALFAVMPFVERTIVALI